MNREIALAWQMELGILLDVLLEVLKVFRAQDAVSKSQSASLTRKAVQLGQTSKNITVYLLWLLRGSTAIASAITTHTLCPTHTMIGILLGLKSDQIR